ncbi:unnamed protein product [Brugia timori]|uniref:Uncharacterized protein n=1 Tax=Brugia timori TaxID=42155 RepID=A0A3P7WLJ5_9BILA|nr:unnamed protein product [Brugia timori]
MRYGMFSSPVRICSRVFFSVLFEESFMEEPKKRFFRAEPTGPHKP